MVADDSTHRPPRPPAGPRFPGPCPRPPVPPVLVARRAADLGPAPPPAAVPAAATAARAGSAPGARPRAAARPASGAALAGMPTRGGVRTLAPWPAWAGL